MSFRFCFCFFVFVFFVLFLYLFVFGGRGGGEGGKLINSGYLWHALIKQFVIFNCCHSGQVVFNV